MAGGSRWIREAVVVGLIAYAAVAAFYEVFDVLATRGSLYTLNLLGLVVFRGLRDPAVVQVPVPYDLDAMLWYNGLHFVLSLAIGFVVTGLIAAAERRPERGHLMGAIIVAGFVVTVVGVGLVTTAVRPLLPWWSIVLANVLAVLLAGAYLIRRHPGVWRQLIPLPV